MRSKIAFSMIRNINSALASHLLSRIGSEEAFFSLSERELATLGCLPEDLINAEYRKELMRMAEK